MELEVFRLLVNGCMTWLVVGGLEQITLEGLRLVVLGKRYVNKSIKVVTKSADLCLTIMLTRKYSLQRKLLTVK